MTQWDWEESEYKRECKAICKHLRADGCILIVFEGIHGTDVAASVPQVLRPGLPDLFRRLATTLERHASGTTDCCPVCEATSGMIGFEADVRRRENRKPQKGDAALCSTCGSLCRWESASELRLIRDEDWLEIPDDVRIALIRARDEMARRR